MNCMDFSHLIDAYLDGSIDAERSEEIERHLSECTGCARVAAIHRSVYESLNNAPKIKATEGLAESILAAVETEEEEENIIEFPISTPKGKEIGCSVFGEHAAAYVDGLLDTGLSAAMDSHRAGCPACEQLLKAHRAVTFAFRDITLEKAPAGMSERILAAARETVLVETAPAKQPYRRLLPFAAAASLFGVVAALVLIISGTYLPDIVSSVFSAFIESFMSSVTVLPLQAEAWFAAQISPDQWVLIERLTEPVNLPFVPIALPAYLFGMMAVSGAGLVCLYGLIQCKFSSYNDICM